MKKVAITIISASAEYLQNPYIEPKNIVANKELNGLSEYLL